MSNAGTGEITDLVYQMAGIRNMGMDHKAWVIVDNVTHPADGRRGNSLD
jgi:hypothetical protein